MQEKKSLKSCFIVAPLSIDTEPLSNLLTNRGIEVRDSLSLPLDTGSILNTTETIIRKSDFVCAFISRQVSSNIMFEIGVAYGARKPLFLIADKDAELPVSLKDVFYVRASPMDLDAIQFSLDQFLMHPTRVKPGRYIGKTEPSFSKIFNDVDFKFNNYDFESEGELETFVANLFKKANMVVSRESHYKETRVDMAVWVDGIESSLSNPVLVEVKAGRLSKKLLKDSEVLLRSFLNKTPANVALLIYSDHDRKRFPSISSEWPLVIRLDIRDFTDTLSKNMLAATILIERNKSVHRGL